MASLEITPEVIQDLNTTIVGTYEEAFRAAETVTDPIVNEFTVNSEAVAFKALGQVPAMRKWLGSKQVKKLLTLAVTLNTDDYEASISIPRNAVEFDNVGQYQQLASALGQTGAQTQDRLVAETLMAGTHQTGFDSLPVFHASHTLDPAATQSNLKLGRSLTASNFDTTWEDMRVFTGNEGQPLRVKPTYLVVPPQLEADAIAIVKKQYLTNGENNTNFGRVEIIVLDELADEPTVWYLLGTIAGIKPVQMPVAKAPRLVSQTSPESDTVFYNKEYVYSVEANLTMAFPLWFLGIRCIA